MRQNIWFGVGRCTGKRTKVI